MKFDVEVVINLTFRGLYIVIYSYNKSQSNALFLIFILVKNSTRFGQIYCPYFTKRDILFKSL